jgi:hypothetical protein
MSTLPGLGMASSVSRSWLLKLDSNQQPSG